MAMPICCPPTVSAKTSRSAARWAGRDPRFANFHRLFVAIEPGMTRAEVGLTIDAHYPEGGERLRPTHWDNTPQHLGLFMNPEHLREPNCEGISIRFVDGKVVGKGYSMD